MIKISVEAADIQSAIAQLQAIQEHLNPEIQLCADTKNTVKLAAKVVAEPIEQNIPPVLTDEDSMPERRGGFPEKKKPGRKPGAKPKNAALNFNSEQANAVIPEEKFTEISPEPSQTPPTRSEAIEALRNLNNVKGMPQAKAVLSQFKCNRISELKEEDFRQFIKACTQATL